MADGGKQDAAMESDEKEQLSKALAKRKYLLVDEDLDDLDHELQDNPINKGYAPMKVFKASEVKRVAIDKWGSLENIDIEQQRRTERQTNMAEKKEQKMRQFWDCEEIYEPMKAFMDRIDLPKTNAAEEESFAGETRKSLITSDVILCFCDCMNSRPPGSFGKAIYKSFPAASEVNNSTPYNDRRKMGHFTWVVVNNGNKDQLIVNLYVVHKWNFKSKGQPSVLIFGALELALTRLTKLLVEEWKRISENKFCLSIGTYLPYKVEPEQFNNTLKESFGIPVQVFTDLVID